MYDFQVFLTLCLFSMSSSVFELDSLVASNGRSSILVFVSSKLLDDLSHVCLLSAMEVAIALDAASAVCCAATLCYFVSVDASV